LLNLVKKYYTKNLKYPRSNIAIIRSVHCVNWDSVLPQTHDLNIKIM